MAGLQLTDAQKAQLQPLIDSAVAAGPTALGAWAPVYDQLYQYISNDTMSGPAAGVDNNVWLWVRGARLVNAGQGPFANFIREYTSIQYKLRTSQDLSAADLNRASNGIAQAFVSDVLARGVPDIAGTGFNDAGPTASTLFGDNFSPWAGTLLFSSLGYDQFFRDWILNPGTSAQKQQPGTYDLIAAAQSVQDYSALGGLWPFLQYLGESVDMIGQLAQYHGTVNSLITDTNAWFNQVYGFDSSDANVTVGSDTIGLLATATNLFKSAHYAVGSYGNDVIGTSPAPNGSYVTGGNDVVNAGPGDDTIIGSTGRDLIDGAAGFDTLDFSSFSRNLTVTSDTKGYDGSRLIIDSFPFNRTYAYSIESLKLGSGNDTVTIHGPSSLKELFTGPGNDTVNSTVPNLKIYFGNGNDTLLDAGPGSIVYAGTGQDTFDLSDKVLIAGATPTDKILTASGRQLHGALGSMNTESPWVGQGDGLWYAIDVAGELVIRNAAGQEMFVGGYQGGPNVPLSQQTAGILIGRLQIWASKLLDLTRPYNSYIDSIFKAGNDVWFTKTGQANLFNADPLVLDLNGDGLNLTGMSSIAPSFDMFGTNFAVPTGWVQPTDGILVLDKNNNGKIDNVGELFGGQGASGFAALAAYDLNGDGVIDASDAVYSQLRVWQDANGNAVADPGELHTLADLGIASISVAGTAQTGVSVAGNQVTATGTFTRTDGSTGSIGNVTFTTDPFDSKYLGDTSVSPQAALEPNLKGYGTLADLRVAMTLDPTLIDTVNANLPNLSSLDLASLRDAALPMFVAWARAVPLPDANGNPQIVDPATGHHDVPILVQTDASGNTSVVDFGYLVTDANGSYYQLASGNAVRDSNNNVIARPTLADVMAQPGGSDTRWNDFTAAEIGFMTRYLGQPFPIDQISGDVQGLIPAIGDFLNSGWTALNLEAVRLAIQGPLAQYFPGIAFDAASNTFHATTDQQLAPMYGAIFAAAPGDAAGALAWLASWKPIIDIVLGDFARGQGQTASFAYTFASIRRASRSTARRCRWRTSSSICLRGWPSRWRSGPDRAGSLLTCSRRWSDTSRRYCERDSKLRLGQETETIRPYEWGRMAPAGERLDRIRPHGVA
jgi:hypothetical protein